MSIKRQSQKGFTLIELMTSLSIFMIIMVISMGSILGVFDANRKSQSESIVMNNLNLAIESMARDMRFGRNYHCGIGSYATPQSCPLGDTIISFKNVDNDQMVYKLSSGGALERSSDGGASFTAVTAPEIVIENLTFYALGAEGSPANSIQPKVLISVKGFSETKARSRTEFSLQTLVSQRCLDNGQCND
jgi:prepilin-type N-terminal cleavage/methylation domain-containing protein